MGKKIKGNSLGRSLIKDRFSSRRINKAQDSLLHTSELNDGYDWGRLNLQSVTEQNSFEEFLSTAEIAGTEFQAEKLNVTFVYPNSIIKGVTSEERERFEKTRQEKKKFIRIPRRPKWNETTSKEKLDLLEKEAFLEWRHSLAVFQEKDGLTLTPYEKNLEFWRQLWRVVERSDVVIQIVDARNPLLFRCEDLECYVKDLGKKNLLLVNKADLLREEERRSWAKWFRENKCEAIFFSAINAANGVGDEEEEEVEEVFLDAGDSSELEEGSNDDDDYVDASCEDSQDEEPPPSLLRPSSPLLVGRWKIISASDKLLGRSELISLLESFSSKNKQEGKLTTIGLVGYPNVGKSSTINSLIGDKKVSVSATPGKTKHFQTIYLTKDVMLCDCPGLVMPSLVESKESMLLGGILPSDRGGDLTEAVTLLCTLMGRTALQHHYSVVIPQPPQGESRTRPPTAHEFLGVYAYSRGFMTSGGRADTSRAARYIVKDFINGKLVYVRAPPGTKQEEFNLELKEEEKKPMAQITRQTLRATQMSKIKSEDVDEAFFNKLSLGAHTKSTKPVPSNSGQGAIKGKPWKDHSEKRNKREKLRRVYRHLDE